jgi:hypothetical protein
LAVGPSRFQMQSPTEWSPPVHLFQNLMVLEGMKDAFESLLIHSSAVGLLRGVLEGQSPGAGAFGGTIRPASQKTSGQRQPVIE